MKVKQHIEEILYKNLIEYAIENNDVISVTYRPNQHGQEYMKIIDSLLKLDISKRYIINNYSDEFVDSFFEKYKNNEVIFDEEYIEKYEKGIRNNINRSSYKKNKYEQRLDYINSNFKKIFYDYVVKEFLNKYKSNIVHEEKSFYKNKNGNEILISIKYYLKLSEELKINILRKNSIYDWCFPISIEDLEFYKDGYCWLLSVAHERIFDIFCKDEEEFEYLKSIGIEFVDENYIPLKKQHTIYKNYNDAKNTIYYI